MARTNKQPAFLFYTGDWLKDPQLSLCSPATRGVWMDLLCAMHEASRSGELRGTIDQLARVSRCSTADLSQALTDLQTTGAAGVTERNGVFTIMSRRMMRECKERNQAALRQSKKRRHGSSHSGVAPPSSSSFSSSIPPPPNQTQFKPPKPATEERTSSGLAGGGDLDTWGNPDNRTRATLALRDAKFARVEPLIVECKNNGIPPSAVVRACQEFKANSSKFDGPGAIAEFLRSGAWPASGVVPVGEKKVSPEKRKLEIEGLRRRLKQAGVKDVGELSESEIVSRAKEMQFT